MVVVPGRGWSFHRETSGNIGEFGLLGPFSAGQIIDRLEVFWSADAASVLTVAPVIGASSVANADSFVAGRPLIQRSEAVFLGVPTAQFDSSGVARGRIVIPVGLRVEQGATFIVCLVSGDTGGVTMQWFVGAFVLIVVADREGSPVA